MGREFIVRTTIDLLSRLIAESSTSLHSVHTRKFFGLVFFPLQTQRLEIILSKNQSSDSADVQESLMGIWEGLLIHQ